MMRTASCLAVAALTVGCTIDAPSSRSDTPVAFSSPPTSYAPPKPSSSAEGQVAVSRPPLRRGKVPSVVVGAWTGGSGDKTGEYLVITAAGQYARGLNGEDPYRQGVIVAEGSSFVAYDVDGRQEAGSWEYTDAAGIIVLGVYFGSDYYSYVRV